VLGYNAYDGAFPEYMQNSLLSGVYFALTAATAFYVLVGQQCFDCCRSGKLLGKFISHCSTYGLHGL
jgi:hypothetical protein